MTDEKLAKLADEIREYLTNHPNAADSLDGVAKWWLRRQRFEQSRSRIKQALDILETQGVVKRTSAVNPVYSLANKEPPDGEPG